MAQHWQEQVNKTWDESIIAELKDYIRIPNKSPMFDAKWQENSKTAMEEFCIPAFVQLGISVTRFDFGLAQQSNTKKMYLSVLA